MVRSDFMKVGDIYFAKLNGCIAQVQIVMVTKFYFVHLLFFFFFFFFFFFLNFIVPHSYMPPVRGLAPGGLCLNITLYYIVIQRRIGYV